MPSLTGDNFKGNRDFSHHMKNYGLACFLSWSIISSCWCWIKVAWWLSLIFPKVWAQLSKPITFSTFSWGLHQDERESVSITTHFEMISTRDRVWRRAGHISFSYEGEMWVWGGYIEHLSRVSSHHAIIARFNRFLMFQKPKPPNSIPTNANAFMPTDELVVYDPAPQTWRKVRTGGCYPSKSIGASG